MFPLLHFYYTKKAENPLGYSPTAMIGSLPWTGASLKMAFMPVFID